MSIPWVSVASQWLRENTPVSKEVALTELTKMMPLGVRSGKRCCDTMHLAKEAIKRAYRKKLYELPDPLPKLDYGQKRTGATDKIKQLSRREQGMTRAEVMEIKNGRKIVFDLVKRGVLVLEGNVYRIKRGNENE